MHQQSKASGGEVLAVFDFDGTITKNDSFNDFIIWRFGYVKFFLAMLFISPLIFLYLCRLVPNHVPKGRLFRLFFQGQCERQFSSSCRSYSLDRLDAIVRDEARKRLRWHIEQGHTVVIVSASIREWIEPWAVRNGVAEVIATTVEQEHGRLTGNFRSKNCYGREKVDRLLQRYPDAGSATVFAYGDSRGDKELLKMATHSFYRAFD